jgi:hypothetical protein
MEQQPKTSIMLSHISWTTYLLSVLVLLAIYYSWVGIRFFRKDLLNLGGDKSGNTPAQFSSLHSTSASVMGAIAPEPEQLQDESDLYFGDPEPDELTASKLPIEIEPSATAALEMEVQALVEVITESRETKENFLMLFRLLAEKYATEIDHDQQAQINLRLLEHADDFPFQLSLAELKEQWYEPVNI